MMQYFFDKQLQFLYFTVVIYPFSFSDHIFYLMRALTLKGLPHPSPLHHVLFF